MQTIELHQRGMNSSIQVNPAAIIFYEPVEGNHCRLWLYGEKIPGMLELEESYDKVNDILYHYEFVNEQHWISIQAQACLYTDFLHTQKQNPILDEFLKWKGRNELLSSKRFIDADELLKHVGRDELDSREKIINLIESLIIKDEIS